MTKDLPRAGDRNDPRVLALAHSRQERLARNAPYGKPAPSWDELTERQRKARIEGASEWILDAYLAKLLPAEHQPQPGKEQFTAIEDFLTARRDEIEQASAPDRPGAVIPWSVLQAARMVRDRIVQNLFAVRLALYGDAEHGLRPSWTPSAQSAWADTLRCAEAFSSHADYAPETWTP